MYHSILVSSDDLFELYSKRGLEKSILMFKGVLTQDILVLLAEMLANNLTNFSHLGSTKKMFSIFVELAQNIHRYSAERMDVDGKEVGCGIVLVNEYDGYYSIISGNIISQNQIENLSHHLELINKMDPDELKKLRKELLRKDRVQGKKGAGIGLIDIVRKANASIDYKIKPIREGVSFISFFIQLDKGI